MIYCRRDFIWRFISEKTENVGDDHEYEAKKTSIDSPAGNAPLTMIVLKVVPSGFYFFLMRRFFVLVHDHLLEI